MLMPTPFKILVQVRRVRSPLDSQVYLLPEQAGTPVGEVLPQVWVGLPPLF